MWDCFQQTTADFPTLKILVIPKFSVKINGTAKRLGRIDTLKQIALKTNNDKIFVFFKWYYDENRVFPIEAILKHKQVVGMRRKMPFTVF